MSRLIASNGEQLRRKIRVAVAVPAGDSVATGFAYDLARMLAVTAAQRSDIELRLFVNRDTILPRQRRDLVRQALDAEMTHVLFIDSDMRFPKDALVRLLERQQPVVGVTYPARRYPQLPTARTADGAPVFAEGDELIAVTTAGFGLMLIDADVFRQMEEPWFITGYVASANQYVGEDAFFCRRITDAGLSVFVDPVLSRDIAHLGEMEFRDSHGRQLHEMLSTADGTD